MPSTVAFTIALGRDAGNAARLVRATFKAHHSDVPFFIVDESILPTFLRQPAVGHNGEIMGMRIMVGAFLSLCFERVIYLDADVLVLAPLDGLMEGAVVLTHDQSTFTYGVEAPIINAGVLAAADPRFWRVWMLFNFSHLIPILGGTYFDQLSLRILAGNGAFPHQLMPEKESRDFYNISYLEYPGEWRREGDRVFKGDARVRLWHWAGYGKKTSFDRLPPSVLEAAQAGLDPARVDPDFMAENKALHALLAEKGPAFFAQMEALFHSLQSPFFDHIHFLEQKEEPEFFGTDAPAAWDALRPAAPGVHRRLLGRAPRYLYARDPGRLQQPDIDVLDTPRPTA